MIEGFSAPFQRAMQLTLENAAEPSPTQPSARTYSTRKIPEVWFKKKYYFCTQGPFSELAIGFAYNLIYKYVDKLPNVYFFLKVDIDIQKKFIKKIKNLV